MGLRRAARLLFTRTWNPNVRRKQGRTCVDVVDPLAVHGSCRFMKADTETKLTSGISL
jgi:hypothetical protein